MVNLFRHTQPSPSRVITRSEFERGQLEQELRQTGRILIGIDEVGRGCLAGPVHAAAVCLDIDLLQSKIPDYLRWVRDSKTLSAAKRQTLLPLLREAAVFASIQIASPREIDEVNISGACFLAMQRCLTQLPPQLDRDRITLLVDGNKPIPGVELDQVCVIGGDLSCLSIAAASILAKEARDDFMREAARDFPQFGFDRHVGYGTKTHLDLIRIHGICDLHRRGFKPISDILLEQRYPQSQPLFSEDD